MNACNLRQLAWSLDCRSCISIKTKNKNLMKNLSKLTLIIMLLGSFAFQANANGEPNSKLVEQAKKAVDEAEANDWETLAQSAEICLIKKENIKEAAEWIDKSIAIKATPYNLELKGDYLKSIGKKKEATSFYYMAIVQIKNEDSNKDTSDLQSKMWALR